LCFVTEVLLGDSSFTDRTHRCIYIHARNPGFSYVHAITWVTLCLEGAYTAAMPLDCSNITPLLKLTWSGTHIHRGRGCVSTSHTMTCCHSRDGYSHHLPKPLPDTCPSLPGRRVQRTATCDRRVSLRRDAGHITPVHSTPWRPPHRASFYNCQSRHKRKCSFSADGNRDHSKILRARGDI
jgi:hypothetical protein